MDERFRKVEDEYFRLKGQLQAGRITHEQFETALKGMMIQDAQGRYWMLAVDDAKWYVHDGQNWVEGTPLAREASTSAPAASPLTQVLQRGSTHVPIIAMGVVVVLLLLVGALIVVANQGMIQISLGPTATPTINVEATRAAQAQATNIALAQAQATAIAQAQATAASQAQATATAQAQATATQTRVAVSPSGAVTPVSNVLRLPGNGDPPTLDPALAGDATSANFVVEIFSGLVTLDQNLRAIPDLAEKWEVSGDRQVYTFTLRREAKFHDGRPVTAQDFKYSIERAANPATASSTADTYLGDIVGVKEKLNRQAPDVKGVQVIDNYTLKITIDAPKSYFLAKLTYPTAFVVDKNNVERGGQTWTDKPNGTGPYKLKEYVRGQRIVLSRNASFYLDPKPQVDEVQFFLGGESRMTTYENGDLEATAVAVNDIERVTDPVSPLNRELTLSPQLDTFFLIFNTKKPPFDDANVRKAFALAIDRQKVVDVVYKKIPLLANSILPPGIPGYTQPQTKIPYDPAGAKAALAQSRYAGKLPDITWTAVNGSGAPPQSIQSMTAMLKETLGANVSIQQTDWATFLSLTHNPVTNPFQMFDQGWVADYADPQDFIDILFHTGSNNNWANYSNPDVDKLLDQAAVQTDTATRLRLYQQAEQIILNDYPVIPLTHSREYWLTKAYVKGLIYPPMVIPRLRYVTLAK